MRLRACLKNSGPDQAKNAPRRAFAVKFARGCGAVLGVAEGQNQSSGDTLGGVSRGVFPSRPCLCVQRGPHSRRSNMGVSSVAGSAPTSVEAAMMVKARDQQNLQGQANLDLIDAAASTVASSWRLASSGQLGRHVNTIA